MTGLFEKIALPGVKHIIAVASGKGGVVKSTVAANLAVALSRKGHRVALVDADIFGPSIPRMFGVENARPAVELSEDKKMVLPVEKEGIKILSIAFFVPSGKGLVWRGPMASKALTQMFEETIWGDLDYMILDYPPGTSDIQLTAAQKLNLHGALIVTTPQGISLLDARKAASMFNTQGIRVPILGVVENMSWFSPASHPGERYFLFGKGGGEALATELHVPLLAQIPLVAEVGEAAEQGRNAIGHPEVSEAFGRIIEGLHP